MRIAHLLNVTKGDNNDDNSLLLLLKMCVCARVSACVYVCVVA